jgi:hypothetical protein
MLIVVRNGAQYLSYIMRRKDWWSWAATQNSGFRRLALSKKIYHQRLSWQTQVCPFTTGHWQVKSLLYAPQRVGLNIPSRRDLGDRVYQIVMLPFSGVLQLVSEFPIQYYLG